MCHRSVKSCVLGLFRKYNYNQVNHATKLNFFCYKGIHFIPLYQYKRHCSTFYQLHKVYHKRGKQQLINSVRYKQISMHVNKQ